MLSVRPVPPQQEHFYFFLSIPVCRFHRAACSCKLQLQLLWLGVGHLELDETDCSCGGA